MRFTVALLFCCCAILHGNASPVWVPFSSASPTRPHIEVIGQTDTETILFVRIEGFFLDSALAGTCSVELPGAAKILEYGAPDISKLTTSLILPDRGDVTIELSGSTYSEFNAIDLSPSKGNLYRNQDPLSHPVSRSSVYASDDFYPGKLFEAGTPYILRDFRGLTLSIFPFQYNPRGEVLRVYHALTLRVHYSSALRTRTEFNRVDAAFLPIYKTHFINFNALNYTPLVDQGNMLVLCDSSLMNAIHPFVQWKNQSGQATEVVTIQQIGQTRAQIKSFVESYYNTHGLTFLLLAGDAAQLPPYNSASGDSDPSYGYILGQDAYAEVFVGRFSANSPEELSTQVDRSITYELHPDTATSAYDQAVCIGSSQGPGDDNEYDYEHERNIRQDLLGYTYHAADELYDGTQGLADSPGNPTANDLTSALNAGRGLLTYTGHGSSNTFLTTGFGLSDISGLTAAATLPFIWSVACVNGNFSNSTCLAEGLLRATDSTGKAKGAVATLMSTINQSWDPPMDAQDEMVDLLVESYPLNLPRTFGGLSVNGCMHMNDQYGSAGNEMTDTWTCFGDPSLMVRTATPLPLTVSHLTLIPEATSFFQCQVNLDGARVCISRHDSILSIGWASAGLSNLMLSDLHAGDTLLLTVTGYNALPYQAHVYVISTSTGIPTFVDKPIVSVYPNPAHHKITLQLPISGWSSGTLELMDAIGHSVKSIRFDGEKVIEVDVSGLSRGNYFLKTESGSQKQILPLILQ